MENLVRLFLTIALLLSGPAIALADMSQLFRSDRTDLQTVQKRLSEQLKSKNLTITGYSETSFLRDLLSKAVDSFGGTTLALRSLSFEFEDENGKTQAAQCEVSIYGGREGFIVGPCKGTEKPIAEYVRTSGFKLTGDSFSLPNVIRPRWEAQPLEDSATQ